MSKETVKDKNVQLLAAFVGAAVGGALVAGTAKTAGHDPAALAVFGGLMTSGLTVGFAATTKLIQQFKSDYAANKAAEPVATINSL